MNRRNVLAIALAASVAAGGIAAASSCSDEPGATTDAGTPDARRDAKDGVAPTDASDGSADGGLLDGWTKVPWLPSDKCEVYQPSSPDVLGNVRPVAWEACSSGRPGCRQNANDWGTSASLGAVAFVGDVDGALVVLFTRVLSPQIQEATILIDEKVAWSFRYVPGSPGCIFSAGAFGKPGRLYLTAATKSGSTFDKYYDLIGTVDEVVKASVATYVYSGADVFAAGLSNAGPANPFVVTSWVPSGDALSIRNRATNVVDPLLIDGGRAMASNWPVVVDDEVFFFSRLGGVSAWDPDGGLRVLRSGLAYIDPIVPHDIGTDGTYIAWVESAAPDGGFFTESKVQLSPYTKHSSALIPEAIDSRICPVTMCGITVSEGYVAYNAWSKVGAPDIESRIVRISDRAKWTLKKQGPDVDYGVGVIVHGELWATVNQTAGKRVVRIKLSALGAPDKD